MTTIQIDLPDDLHKLVQEAGMLTPQALEQLLQDALKRQELKAAAKTAKDPAFGMWADRNDMADVPAYLRKIRAPRFRADGLSTRPSRGLMP